MKKKFYLIIIAFLFLVTLATILIYAFVPRLTFEYSNDYNGYLVTKAYGLSSKYEIPKEIKNKPVVGIKGKAFFHNNKITDIIFEDPNNIIYIGKEAFAECHNLKNIDLSNVLEIERNAFSHDENLLNVTLKATNIGASAFYGCTSIDSITLNEGISSIGSMAFAYTKIEELTLPKSLANLYVDSLKYLDKLNKINVYTNNNLTSTSRDYLANFNSIIELI